VTSVDHATIREQVRDTYAAAALAAQAAPAGPNRLAETIYGPVDTTDPGAAAAALGCANPTALIDLQPGQTVLDLGSGGGLDVLRSARRVGPTGRVIGIDMTPEMLALAEANRAAAGLDNVEFRLGHIENLPLPDHSVDVVVSNCVLSLSPHKEQVLAEAWRVLVPGGRLAFADLATLSPLPVAITQSLAAWVGCLAGAWPIDTWAQQLAALGFVDVDVQVVRTFGRADLDLLDATPLGRTPLADLTDDDLAAADGKIASVHLTARKPAAATAATRCC